MARLRRRTTPHAPAFSYRTILHIDSGWVHALILEMGSGTALIVGAGREARLDMGPEIDPTSLAPVCESALRIAENMTADVVGHVIVPDQAILSISGPHLVSLSAEVKVRRSAPNRPLGKREHERLLNRLSRTTQSRLASLGGDRTPIILHASVVHLAVDGHAVTTPLQFRGKEVEARSLVIGADHSIMEEMRALARSLKLEAMAVALPWAIANMIEGPDAVWLIVDEHQATLYRTEGGRLVGLEIVDCGREALMRDLAVDLGLPEFRAEALLAAHATGEVGDYSARVMDQVVEQCVARWTVALEPGLARLCEQTSPPLRLRYWELAKPWPRLGDALTSWMNGWGLSSFPEVQRLGFRDCPTVSDRTGATSAMPARTALCALAHHAAATMQAAGADQDSVSAEFQAMMSQG
jgi:hypothetical protein